MNDPILIRSGFDTIELAYRAAIPDKFLRALASAKSVAAEKRKSVAVTVNGYSFLVEPSGGQGGFAYRVDTGAFGAIWKFREIGSKDQWTAHAKIKAHSLATRGYQQCKIDCDNFLIFAGARFDPSDARVGRADFAFDFYAPFLSPQLSEIVSHARTQKSEIIERGSTGEKTNYFRIGKMPGKQVCIYNKSGAINQGRDLIWNEVLKSAANSNDIIFSERTLGIWRIEFRSGKDHIDKFLVPNRRWDLFDNRFKSIFEDTLNSISWRLSQNDSNRSRWQMHPTWIAIKKEIGALNFNRQFQIEKQILVAIRDEYLTQLDSQIMGLLLTIAANNDISARNLNKFVKQKTSEIEERLSSRSDLELELSERSSRFHLKFNPI